MIIYNFYKLWQQFQWGDQVDAISAKDLDVVVIGGGDTGNDCIGKITIFNFTKKSYFFFYLFFNIGTSLRQGAKSITTFEILPQPPDSRGAENPWPQYPKVFKVDYGHEEVIVKHGGDPRRFNTQSKEFLVDENGRVSGIKTTLGKYLY